MCEHVQRTSIQSTHLKFPSFLEEPLAFVAILAFSLISSYFMLHPQSVSASAEVNGSCSSSHCYGSTVWSGHMYGAATAVGVRGIGGGNGFTLNGLWVIDTNPGEVEDCRVFNTSKRGYCWIEVEYKAFSGSEQWVWADVRPGYRYYEHDLGQLASGDYGNFASLQIAQIAPNSTTWNIDIVANISSYFNEYSTGNSMYADAIRIGMELSGTSGWSAPVAHFIYNQWINSSGTFNYQNVTGNKDPQTYPAYGNWAAYPKGASNNGGDWYTCVQGAGC